MIQCTLCGRKERDVLGGEADRNWSQCGSSGCNQFICTSCDKKGHQYCRGHERAGPSAGPRYSTHYGSAHPQKARTVTIRKQSDFEPGDLPVNDIVYEVGDRVRTVKAGEVGGTVMEVGYDETGRLGYRVYWDKVQPERQRIESCKFGDELRREQSDEGPGIVKFTDRKGSPHMLTKDRLTKVIREAFSEYSTVVQDHGKWFNVVLDDDNIVEMDMTKFNEFQAPLASHHMAVGIWELVKGVPRLYISVQKKPRS